MPQKEEEERDESDFTHIGLKKDTKKKIVILTKIFGGKQFRLIKIWADDAWNLAKRAGLVTDAMLDTDPDMDLGGLSKDDRADMQRLLDSLNKGKK